MDQYVGQPQFLKEVNYNIVNNLIAEKGPISKPQISQITGLSLPTVNKIVYYLEGQKRIKEAGTTTGLGRKAILYVTNEELGNILTLSLNGKSFTCCVVNMVGDIIHRFTTEFDTSDYDSSIRCVMSAVERLMDNCSAKVMSIGVGLPGWVGLSGVVINAPTVPVWNNVDLRKVLSDQFNVPVYIESNVRFATIGYYAWTLKKACHDMVYISVDKELSSGMILNDKLYSGYSCFAGACGYMSIGGDIPKGKSLGDHVSEIVEKMRITEERDTLIQLRKELVTLLAGVIINYISIVNPEIIVLDGPVINKELAKEISDYINRVIPQMSVPSILVDNNSMSDTYGIITWCKYKMNTGYNIIKDA